MQVNPNSKQDLIRALYHKRYQGLGVNRMLKALERGRAYVAFDGTHITVTFTQHHRTRTITLNDLKSPKRSTLSRLWHNIKDNKTDRQEYFRRISNIVYRVGAFENLPLSHPPSSASAPCLEKLKELKTKLDKPFNLIPDNWLNDCYNLLLHEATPTTRKSPLQNPLITIRKKDFDVLDRLSRQDKPIHGMKNLADFRDRFLSLLDKLRAGMVSEQLFTEIRHLEDFLNSINSPEDSKLHSYLLRCLKKSENDIELLLQTKLNFFRYHLLEIDKLSSNEQVKKMVEYQKFLFEKAKDPASFIITFNSNKSDSFPRSTIEKMLPTVLTFEKDIETKVESFSFDSFGLSDEEADLLIRYFKKELNYTELREETLLVLYDLSNRIDSPFLRNWCSLMITSRLFNREKPWENTDLIRQREKIQDSLQPLVLDYIRCHPKV